MKKIQLTLNGKRASLTSCGGFPEKGALYHAKPTKHTTLLGNTLFTIAQPVIAVKLFIQYIKEKKKPLYVEYSFYSAISIQTIEISYRRTKNIPGSAWSAPERGPVRAAPSLIYLNRTL